MTWDYPLWEELLFYGSLSIIMASVCFLGLMLDIVEMKMISRVKIRILGSNKKVFFIAMACAIVVSIITICLLPHSSELIARVNLLKVIATL